MALANSIIKSGVKSATGSKRRCVTYCAKFPFSMRLHEIRKAELYREAICTRQARTCHARPSNERCENGNEPSGSVKGSEYRD
jgi:hypothetical protein